MKTARQQRYKNVIQAKNSPDLPDSATNGFKLNLEGTKILENLGKTNYRSFAIPQAKTTGAARLHTSNDVSPGRQREMIIQGKKPLL